MVDDCYHLSMASFMEGFVYLSTSENRTNMASLTEIDVLCNEDNQNSTNVVCKESWL